MNLARLAKWLTLGGGAISAIAANGISGRWQPAIGSVGAALVAIGAAVASQTSAGHPNGANS